MNSQIGDMYVKVIEADNGDVLKVRLIKPVGGMIMMKCDVIIVPQKRMVEVVDVMFYKRGDKDAEKSALEG